MPVYLWDSGGFKPLVVDGKIAVHEDCCCEEGCILIKQLSGSVPGISGSSVVTDPAGGSIVFLFYYGVDGYWLGRLEDGGRTQSVTISFSDVIPYKADLFCSAIDDEMAPEALLYSFTGASSIVFTDDAGGGGFVDTGSRVTRPGLTGNSRCKIVATGTITEISFTGEMTDGGSNGIIVSICVYV